MKDRLKEPLKNVVTVGVIGGKGKMGNLFAEIFRRNGFSVIISDLSTKLKNHELVKKADIIIVAVPINETRDVIKKIVRYLNPSKLIMDITSIKSEPVKIMLEGLSCVIGLHPMFNETTFGAGQTIIVCPERPGKWLKFITKIFENEGLLIKMMNPQKHDEIMAVVQGLVHSAEISFIHALKSLKCDIKDFLNYAGPASALKIMFAARILAQDPNLYGQIQMSQKENAYAQEAYGEALEKLTKIVESKNEKAFLKYFQDGVNYLGDLRTFAMKETDWLIAQYLEKKIRQAPKKLPETQSKKPNIALLGPSLTFTDQATNLWKKNATKKYCDQISEVFKSVEKGEVKEGLVPIENRLHGSVRDTLDALFRSKTYIFVAIDLPIHHCLCALKGVKLQDIKAVMSHPQTFYQCEKFLKRRLKQVEWISAPSTTQAMEKIKRLKDENTGTIGSKLAAKTLRLNILAENIENDRNNQTRFIVIKKIDAKRKRVKTKKYPIISSIIFYFSEDSPGSLSLVLNEFASAKINITKIESRPSTSKYGKYLFFLDFEGSTEDQNVQKILNNMKKFVAGVKFLGSYPVILSRNLPEFLHHLNS